MLALSISSLGLVATSGMRTAASRGPMVRMTESSVSVDAAVESSVETEATPSPPPSAQAPSSKYSKAIPFLSKPKALDGSMLGDVGFDPLGLSSIDTEYINLKWMREAELKHGRLAMLAFLGYVMVDIGFKLPGYKYAGLTSLNAHDAMVYSGDMFALFLVVAGVEAYTGMKLFEKGHTPGDYGFDPLELGKVDADMPLRELKNGRLAMLAFSGVVTQAALTGKGFPYF